MDQIVTISTPIDYWISWMLGIGAIILTIITLIFVCIGFLIWKHIDQAKKAEKLISEVEERKRQFEESANFIADTAGLEIRKTILRKKSDKYKAILSKEDVVKRAKSHRAFAPILYRTFNDNAVFALDEFGYKHWIPDPPTLRRMGYSWTDIKEIEKEKLDKIPTGEHIPKLG